MKGLLAAAEFPDSADASEGATIADTQIGTDRFRLFASYNADGFDAGAELTNVWYFRPLDKNGNGPFQQVPDMDRITLASDNNSGFVENGNCLPGGDYRVEVYAGHNLMTTVEKNIGDSPLGALQVEGGDEIGFTLCRPRRTGRASRSPIRRTRSASPTPTIRSSPSWCSASPWVRVRAPTVKRSSTRRSRVG